MIFTLHQVSKRYDTSQALAETSLQFKQGQSVAIMGASGSGKSTLLHLMAGIILSDTGTVQYQDTKISALSAEERSALRLQHFGFVFQQGLLLPELTALENVILPLLLQNIPRKQAEKQAFELLKELEVFKVKDNIMGQMSGGQAQRVAIARAMICDPEVIFADEPTGALDSSTAASVMQLLLQAVTSRGKTLIIITHDEKVAQLCDRTLRLEDGVIVSDQLQVGDAS